MNNRLEFWKEKKTELNSMPHFISFDVSVDSQKQIRSIM